MIHGWLSAAMMDLMGKGSRGRIGAELKGQAASLQNNPTHPYLIWVETFSNTSQLLWDSVPSISAAISNRLATSENRFFQNDGANYP